MTIKQSMLVFDDEIEIAVFIKGVAEEFNYDVTASSQSSRFMELYNLVKPEVIVLDICMPEQDGIEIMRRLARLKCSSHLLFISSSGDFYLATTKKLAKDFGLANVSVMHKPLNHDDLRTYFGHLG